MLFSGIKVRKGTVIKNSVILPNVVIGENTSIDYSIIDVGCNILDGAVIGSDAEGADKITVIGADITIGEGAVVPAGEMIEEDFNS